MVAITTPPTSGYELLRTSSGLPKAARIDRDRNVIYGVAVLQKGDLNDERPWAIDDLSLSQAIKLIKTQPRGAKSRFTHPNMSNDGLGKFIGRIRKPRLSSDGEYVVADLHLAKVAFKTSLHGMQQNLGDYVLSLAEEDPEAFGLSLAPKLDRKAMEELKEKGVRTPMRFAAIHAADVVDEPAATRGGLFGGAELSIASAPALATAALDKLFASADKDTIRERTGSFLETYLANRFDDQGKPGDVMAEELTMKDVESAIAKNNESLLNSIKELLPQPKSEKTDEDLSSAPTAAEIQKQAQELTALSQVCGLSNADKLLADWLGKLSTGFTVTDAKAQIADLAIKNNKLTDGDPDPGDDAGIDQKLSAAYDEHASLRKSLGLSKKDWVEHAKKQLEREAEAAA